VVKIEVEKKEYGFRLRVNDNESYFINDKGSWYTLVIENADGEMIDAVDDRYENLGTRDINDLLCKLIENPKDVLEMLIGERLEKIEKITVEFD